VETHGVTGTSVTPSPPCPRGAPVREEASFTNLPIASREPRRETA